MSSYFGTIVYKSPIIRDTIAEPALRNYLLRYDFQMLQINPRGERNCCRDRNSRTHKGRCHGTGLAQRKLRTNRRGPRPGDHAGGGRTGLCRTRLGLAGYFGVHTWIAVKPTKAPEYTVYEVIGWRLRWGESALVVRHRAPDARWFGNAPALLIDLRGDGVDDIIRRVDVAARRTPMQANTPCGRDPTPIHSPRSLHAKSPSSKLICRRRRLEKIIWAAGWWPKRRAALGLQFSLLGLFGVLGGGRRRC